MAGGTGQDAPDTEQAPLATARATPIVLDDSDYAIPDEWGLKEAYNDEESVVHHGDTSISRALIRCGTLLMTCSFRCTS